MMAYKKLLKTLSFWFIALLLSYTNPLLACEVCKKNQPKGLENITHGVGPEGMIDYVISWSAVILVIITLVLSIKYLVRPNEDREDHIKFRILESQE